MRVRVRTGENEGRERTGEYEGRVRTGESEGRVRTGESEGESQIQNQNPFLTAQSTQIKSVISVPIKDFIHHYPRALFNDIPRVGPYFYDMPGSGRTFTTYPGRGAV